jgi:hypothetical protein
VEFTALKREWCRARNIPMYTKEQKENLENGRQYIQQAFIRAYARQAEKVRASGLHVVSNIPERKESRNG